MFPAGSAKIWISWLKGEVTWSPEVRTAVLTVVGHASDFARLPTPMPNRAGAIANPRQPNDLALEILTGLISETPPAEPNWLFLSEHGLQTVQQSLGRRQANAPTA